MTYKEIYKILKKKILKDYGKPCPDFDLDCWNCRAHLILRMLEDVIDIEEMEET